MKNIILMTFVMLGSCVMLARLDKQAQEECYRLLEQPSMTVEERAFVNSVTGPPDCIPLDEEHLELFKKHFGRER